MPSLDKGLLSRRSKRGTLVELEESDHPDCLHRSLARRACDYPTLALTATGQPANSSSLILNVEQTLVEKPYAACFDFIDSADQPHGSFWQNSAHFFKHLGDTNPTSFLIGGIALVVLILGKIFLKNKPVALFVVVGGIVAASVFSLSNYGVKLLGQVPEGLPALGLPAIRWDDLNELLPLALACFLLGAVETAALGRMFTAKHGGRFDANQEFLALATANLAAGIGRGFPISGGMSQSLVNEGGGARTPFSTVIAAGILLIVVLFFTHLLSALPQPVLAAVVLVAVAGLLKLSTLKQLWRGDRAEFVVAIAAILGVLTSGLLRGVMVGPDGVVYEKDLGPDTLKTFQTMDSYNPDKTWKETEDEWPEEDEDQSGAQ